MPTIFVAKDGNDANSGASYALAKLTINGAIAVAAASGDTIQVKGGVYVENVATGNKGFILQGDGLTIIDGNGAGTGIDFSGASSKSLTVNDVIIQGFATAINCNHSGSGALFINRCIIRNCTTGWLKSANGPSDMGIRESLIHNCTTGVSLGTSSQTMQLVLSTVADCTTGVVKSVSMTNGNIGLNIFGCVFSNNTTHYNISNTAGLIDINRNGIWFDGVANAFWGGSSSTTLTAWRTLSSRDLLSVSADPLFVDRPKRVYGLRQTSPFLTTIVAGPTSRFTVAMSQNDPDGLFANAILTNVVVNGSGNFELAPAQTVGTVRTPVHDYGAVKGLKRIGINTNLDALRAPTDVPDFDIADALPRKFTIRYRSSLTAFVDVDVSPAWIEIEPGSLGSNVSVTAQYVQVEVTLRSNGV